MIINGKDRQFELTVQAHSEISKLCQDEDFAKIDKLFSTSSALGNENLMRIAIIMNRAYEDHRNFEDPSHEQEYLTTDDFKFMLFPEFAKLEVLLMKTMRVGTSVEVVGEPPKSKGKNVE